MEETLILTLVNTTTGETKSHLVDPTKTQKAAKKRKEAKEPTMPFAALYFDGAKELRKANLQGFDVDLFLYLWSSMRYQNYLTISQSTLAAEMGVNRSQINRSIRKFVKLGVLFPGPDKVTYRLSPKIGYRGTRSESSMALQQIKNGTFKVVPGGPLE